MKKLVILPIVAGALVFGTVGVAQAVGPYAGAQGGVAQADEFCDGARSSCDDESFSLRIYGGSEIDEYLGFEGGYRYIDEYSASGVVSGVPVSAELSAHMFDATLIIGTPANKPFRVFTKIGAEAWRLELDARAGDLSASGSDSGVSVRTGLGAQMRLTDGVRLRAEWDYLIDVGDGGEYGETDVHIISIGPEFRF